ncbi:MAG: winged helix-turn-helix domain-containing protein, partial [Candidatus Binatia bacterium]
METADNTGYIYTFGKFRLDPDEKTLFSDGQALHLPAKEFDTLLFLVEHNRRAMSKEEMMSAIWQDAFVEESNLAKQISRLRKILNTNGEEFIETIPKHGYRFSADLERTSAILDSPMVVEKHTIKRLTLAYDGQPEKMALPSPARPILTLQRAAAVTVLAILAAGGWLWLRRTSVATPKIKIIAVLPLRSLDGDEDGKALGLGLTDSLITKLGSLQKMVVRPINAVTSVSPETDPAEIGRNLNVDAVFEGTIQKADGRLRVNARVLRTTTGEQIWA